MSFLSEGRIVGQVEVNASERICKHWVYTTFNRRYRRKNTKCYQANGDNLMSYESKKSQILDKIHFVCPPMRYAGNKDSSKGHPDRKFVERETLLVRHLLGAGIMSLKDANFSRKSMGKYYIAFFNLSIAMERLMKLIVAAAYVSDHNGKWPREKYLKYYKHDLVKLACKVKHIESNSRLTHIINYKFPCDDLSILIIKNISDFATYSRYANSMIIKNPVNIIHDPILKWKDEVGREILNKEYVGKILEKKHLHILSSMLNLYKEEDLISAFHEGSVLPQYEKDILAKVIQERDKVICKWQHYYTLIVIRWLVCVYSKISSYLSHGKKISSFYDTRELLENYIATDDVLINSNSWPRF